MSEVDEKNPGEIHERIIPDGPLAGSKEWRWSCSCGSLGQWTFLGRKGAHEAFRGHLERRHGGRWS